MSEAAAPGAQPGRPATTDAVAAAKQALDAARAAVTSLVTARTQALEEGSRLRSRSAAPGREALGEDAAVHERRAADLEPRIAELRDLARRAEVAYEALRSGRGAGPSPADGA